MKILAHRGWWLKAEEKNSVAAFARAFDAGYGVETDLRDHNGIVVIAHDMPMGDGCLELETFLELYVSTGQVGTLALNIKADGLQPLVSSALNKYNISNAFVFDMAVPDALGYLRSGLRTYTRHSEFEPTPPFYEEASGVWLDAFNTDWIRPDVVAEHALNGKDVALVSPELHRRPHEDVWREWQKISHGQTYLCTDFPSVADATFNGKTI